MSSETLQASTPIVLAFVGAVIGITAIMTPDLNSDTRANAFGLAGMAITGAAGLAQSSRTNSNLSVQERAGNVSVESTQGD